MIKRRKIFRVMPVLICSCLAGFGLVPLQAGPTETNSPPVQTNSLTVKIRTPETEKPVLKHQLTGAELYSMHCNRCHPERYPTERTAAQWKTVMLHMQVRANVPKKQAELILKYLEDNSGR